MPRKKLVSLTQVITKDIINDEVVDNHFSTTTTTTPEKAKFVLLFLEDILYLSKLPTGYTGVLYSILKRMESDNTVTLLKGRKEAIAEENGLKLKTVEQIIKVLKKGEILFSKERSIYTVNPYLCAKSDWANIVKLRTTVDYSIKGRVFTTVGINKNDTMDSMFDEPLLSKLDEQPASKAI